LRRSLDRAGMCWSQPARVDHMCKKMWVGRRRKFLQKRSFSHPQWRSGSFPFQLEIANLWSDSQGQAATNGCPPATARNLTYYGLLPCHPSPPLFLQFFDFFTFFFGVMRKFGDGPGILEEWV
jgi:hypothetical protein